MPDASISKELLYAILSMDSYNRGYDSAMYVPRTNLGSVEYKLLFEQKRWQDYGFFGAVYEVTRADLVKNLAGVNQVITFRGTDDKWDVVYGWPVGAGLYGYGPLGINQAGLAEDLYKKVAGFGLFEAGTASNVELTGHSLGGGLAGYLSMLTGSKAIGYDHMPFMLAASLRTIVYATSAAGEYARAEVANGRQPNWAAFVNTLPSLSHFNSFKGINMEGEILEQLRSKFFLAIIKDLLPGLIVETVEAILLAFNLDAELVVSNLIDDTQRAIGKWVASVELENEPDIAIEGIVNFD